VITQCKHPEQYTPQNMQRISIQKLPWQQ